MKKNKEIFITATIWRDALQSVDLCLRLSNRVGSLDVNGDCLASTERHIDRGHI